MRPLALGPTLLALVSADFEKDLQSALGPYDDIGEDYQAAQQAWRAVQSSAGSLEQSPAWQPAASELARTLDKIGRELQASRPASLVPTIEGLRDRYYTLLLAVSKTRA